VFKLKKIKMPNRPAMLFPTILVGADVNGKPNYCTVGACGVVNLEPMLYISLKETHYTTTGIKASGFFSVNLPSPDLAEKTDFCGVISGKTIDKSKLFTPFYDESGRAPMIHECPINMLCKVTQTITLSGFAMFLGKIVAVYADEKGLTDGQVDPIKINPLVMMYPLYFELGKIVGTVFKDGNDYKNSLDI
jgi:flavin reductase (DIM6/NTAB) family NADH-FMN oxidoreductase RutF